VRFTKKARRAEDHVAALARLRAESCSEAVRTNHALAVSRLEVRETAGRG
jgi:hypothetical protein